MKSIPVAGVDVSRRFSDMCILSPENEVFARLKIYHDLISMVRTSETLRDSEKKLGGKPAFAHALFTRWLIMFRSVR